jgi:AraC-like DNA-binding protein
MTTTAHSFAWPLEAVPAIRAAGRFALEDQNFNVDYLAPTHALHVYQYAGRIRIGGQGWTLHPGDVTLTPAGVVAQYHLPLPGHHYCVHFGLTPSAAAVETSPTDCLRLPWHMAGGLWSARASEKIMAIAALHKQARPSRLQKAATGTAMQELLLWLAMQQRAQHGAPLRTGRVTQALEQVMQWIVENLERPLAIAELAERVELSPNYLAECFHRAYGQSIHAFALSRRIEHAQYLLEATTLPVKAIGVRVGIADPQYFNKQFRRATGLSPLAFRQRHVALSKQG